MAGYQVRLADEVGAADGTFPETQVGDGQAPGFFGIIFKISLGRHVRMISDDLDGIFRGADSAVSSQSPEFTGYNVPGGSLPNGGNFQGQMGHIICDAHCEHGLAVIGIDCRDLGRRGVLGA